MSERINISKETTDKGTKSVTFSKSWDKNGIHHNKEIRQVEGGYIVTESKYGTPKDEEDAEYIDERKEYVTTENPFKKEEKSEEETMFGFVDTPLM